jgi:hypothetical protein
VDVASPVLGDSRKEKTDVIFTRRKIAESGATDFVGGGG